MMGRFSHDEAVFPGAPVSEQIGSYRLLQELGEGGCGVAYLAEQLAPIRRHVAIKIIKPGMDTRAVVARFRAEQQLLALMDHPNVAKVYDAGSTPAGRPYFVMELVRGIRITDYCNQARCTVAERLGLFIQVCHAIQHAHQKGIIHRDIKPSNVLVTMHDGAAVAKVIDFGIAKATQGGMIDQTAHTAIDQFIGTPEYVSPEQTEPKAAGVDTRSDIYSLGVLLYELLTGHTPFDSAELRQAGIEQMRQLIRTQEPLRPSKRLLAANSDFVDDLAASTGTTSTRLLTQVRGDLDWIVMRCLAKEPGGRYQAVGEVISELERHLHHEPVKARPPQLAYLVAKFARRNRAMFAAMLAAAIFTVGSIVTLSMQTQRIAAAKNRAEQESQNADVAAEFMLETVAKAEPFGYAENGQPETARETLDRAGRWLREHRNQQPEVRARLLESIGRAYRRRMEFPTAISYLADATDLRKGLAGGIGDQATANVMIELAVCMRDDGDALGADVLLVQAADILQRLHLQNTTIYARVLANRGRVQMKLGNLEAAQGYFDESLALMRDLLGPRDPEVAALLVEQSGVYLWKDDLVAAEAIARQAVDIYATTLPKLHPDRTYAEVQWGEALRFQGRWDEAAVVMQEALVATRTIYGEDNRRVADVLDSLGKIALAQGNLAQAERYVQEAVDIQTRHGGADHWLTGYYRTSLAQIQIERGKYAQAEKHLRTALASFRTLPDDHAYIAAAEHYLGEILLRTNRLVDAEAAFTAAMNRSKRANEPPWRGARSASGLGEALYRLGQARDAEPLLVNSYRTLSADKNADASARAAARERVVRFYTEREQRDRLHALLDTTRAQASATSIHVATD